MLDSLNDQSVGNYQLWVEHLGQTRFFDQSDFALYLLDSHANKSDRPIFRGRYNAGRPSIYVPTWIDGEFIEDLSYTLPLARGGSLFIADADHQRTSNSRQAKSNEGWWQLFEQIAQKLGALIPPGGRMWFAYEAFESEGELMHETRAGLLANVPLVTTPIGLLLFRAECWLGMRDLHFPEGGREGPRKLQGNKALNAEHAKERAAELVSVLKNFLEHSAENETEERAKARAKIVLPELSLIG